MWELVGGERVRNLSRTYYGFSNAIIIVTDLSDEQSLTRCSKYVDEIKRHTAPGCVIVIAGNKSDSKDE